MYTEDACISLSLKLNWNKFKLIIQLMYIEHACIPLSLKLNNKF